MMKPKKTKATMNKFIQERQTKATMRKFIQERQVTSLWKKTSNALTGMSLTAAARSEKRSDVASASLLTSLKSGD
jgi:hypothetical protein